VLKQGVNESRAAAIQRLDVLERGLLTVMGLESKIR
jgi:hypothetical protein